MLVAYYLLPIAGYIHAHAHAHANVHGYAYAYVNPAIFQISVCLLIILSHHIISPYVITIFLSGYVFVFFPLIYLHSTGL